MKSVQKTTHLTHSKVCKEYLLRVNIKIYIHTVLYKIYENVHKVSVCSAVNCGISKMDYFHFAA